MGCCERLRMVNNTIFEWGREVTILRPYQMSFQKIAPIDGNNDPLFLCTRIKFSTGLKVAVVQGLNTVVPVSDILIRLFIRRLSKGLISPC